MKYLLMTLLLLFSVPVLALDACVTGAWASADPDWNGEGISVQVLPADQQNKVVVYFYRPGTTNSRWYLFVGERPEDGEDYVELTAYSAVSYGAGGQETGTGSLSVTGDNTLEFSYEFKFDLSKLDDPDVSIPWCLGCNNTFEYVRLTTPIPCS